MDKQLVTVGQTWNHGQAIAHGHDIGATGGFTETKLSRILANHGDILPAETLKSLAGNFEKRWREIDKIHVREKVLYGEKTVHGFNGVSVMD
jgi:hypothetical protein